jgi:hypothetical protein
MLIEDQIAAYDAGRRESIGPNGDGAEAKS